MFRCVSSCQPMATTTRFKSTTPTLGALAAGRAEVWSCLLQAPADKGSGESIARVNTMRSFTEHSFPIERPGVYPKPCGYSIRAEMRGIVAETLDHAGKTGLPFAN